MESETNLSTEDLSQSLAKAKSKIEDTKLLAIVEALQAEIKSEIQVIQNEMRTLVTSRNQQDEMHKNLLYELHQIGELLQKLEQANQYTQRLVQEQEKGIENNRQLINKIEKDIQKLKSVLRVD